MRTSTSPWENLAAQVFLGSAEFLERIEEKVGTRARSPHHPRTQRDFRATAIETVRAALIASEPDAHWPPPARTAAGKAFVILLHRRANATAAEIGRQLGVSAQHAARLLRDCERMEDESVREVLLKAERVLHRD
jgi:hypothetical protein